MREEPEDAARAERQRRVYESFEALAANPDEDSDVEWMLPLQREALELSDAAFEDQPGLGYFIGVQFP